MKLYDEVNIQTLRFLGPVSWSLNSSAVVDVNNENGTSLHFTVPRKSSMKLDPPAQLSVTELAMYNSDVQCSATQDVGDDHEPEWVKNIEMTDNVKPMDSSNLVCFWEKLKNLKKTKIKKLLSFLVWKTF